MFDFVDDNMINRIENVFSNEFSNGIKKSNFEGWILPNGLTIRKNEKLCNHRIIVDTFMKGLEKYNSDLFSLMNNLYISYQNNYLVDGDIHDSFAVEILGWIQVNNQSLIYRGEKWQDKIIFPYLENYKMNYYIYDKLFCQNSKFYELYDCFEEIMLLGLEKNKKLLKKSSVL